MDPELGTSMLWFVHSACLPLLKVHDLEDPFSCPVLYNVCYWLLPDDSFQTVTWQHRVEAVYCCGVLPYSRDCPSWLSMKHKAHVNTDSVELLMNMEAPALLCHFVDLVLPASVVMKFSLL